jgi:hypothetical protein
MWNENEVAARRVIERETERRDLKRSAVSIIETWWKTMVKRYDCHRAHDIALVMTILLAM